MPRSVDLDVKIIEIRNILEKYNGIPSQKEDACAYATIKRYAQKYCDEPRISALMQEFNVVIKKKKRGFDVEYKEIREALEKEGRIPIFKENSVLYNRIRAFFRKYADRPEIVELKYLYAHQSCFPLEEAKATRPEYDTDLIYFGCDSEFREWKQQACYNYILHVYEKYKKLPGYKTKPMDELRYTIKKWYRYHREYKYHDVLNTFVKRLYYLGCTEDFVEEVINSFTFYDLPVEYKIQELLIEHGACAINYIAKKIIPNKTLSPEFIFYYFYNQLNDDPNSNKEIGLGELFSNSSYSIPIYIHYRWLHRCDVTAIRARVITQNRNWEDTPPITLEEWEAFGEYRFFIPDSSSDWNREEYHNTDKSFPQNCIENGHPYFRFYNSGNGKKYLDYKSFLEELGLTLNELSDKHYNPNILSKNN